MEMEKKEILKNYMEKKVFDPNKPYTFISYSHNEEDVEKVYDLLSKLMKEGVNFAIDTEYSDKYGNWMDIMNNRLCSEQCKCMIAFYSRTYVYSRPSLLEQFLRYSLQVTDNAQERKMTYTEDLQKALVSEERMPCIPISLFDSKGIKKEIAVRDDNQIERLKKSKSDWKLDSGSKDYKYFCDGLKGFFENNETLIKNNLFELGKVETDCIRKSFVKILNKEEVANNANLYTEVDAVLAMLQSFGIDKDEEIRKKANALLKDSGATDPIKLSTDQIEPPIGSTEPPTVPIKLPTVPTEPPTDSIDPTGKSDSTQEYQGRYRYKGGKYNAMILVEVVEGKETYVVEAGSKIAPTWNDWVGKKKGQEILNDHCVDENCNVIKNVRFDSISATAKFITGMSTAGNGMIVPKNKVGDSEPPVVIPEPPVDNSEPPVDISKPPVVSLERYNYKGGKYNAMILVEVVDGKETYVVEAGSKIAPTWNDWLGKKKGQEILDNHYVDENCNVIKNIRFESISTTAKFITGTSTAGNGMIVPKNKVDDIQINHLGTGASNKAPVESEYTINHTDAFSSKRSVDGLGDLLKE